MHPINSNVQVLHRQFARAYMQECLVDEAIMYQAGAGAVEAGQPAISTTKSSTRVCAGRITQSNCHNPV